METSEVLNLAADHIERDGWTQGTGWPESDTFTGALCLEGGIMAALGMGYDTSYSQFTRCPSFNAVADYLGTDYVFGWNDEPGRTASEVIEALRACALIESAREQDSAWQTYATNVARVTA